VLGACRWPVQLWGEPPLFMCRRSIGIQVAAIPRPAFTHIAADVSAPAGPMSKGNPLTGAWSRGAALMKRRSCLAGEGSLCTARSWFAELGRRLAGRAEIGVEIRRRAVEDRRSDWEIQEPFERLKAERTERDLSGLI